MKFIILFLSCSVLWAQTTSRVDAHAPIGIMGDHVHQKGEWMFSYRLMSMEMENLLQGTRTVKSSDLFNSTAFMMAPKDMQMWMHMIGAMYAYSDKLTVMLMLPYIKNEMTIARKMQNDEIQRKSSGLGDVSVSALYSLLDQESKKLVVSLGLFLPTGTIDEEVAGTRLGYPMQLGSGSYALKPSLTYTFLGKGYSLGSQVSLKYFVDENDEKYTRGNEYNLDVWGSYQLIKYFSSSLRLSYFANESIDKNDSQINSTTSPANRAEYQHAEALSLFLGANFLGQKFLKDHRFAFEIGKPIYQDRPGTQMKTNLIYTFGWQKAF